MMGYLVLSKLNLDSPGRSLTGESRSQCPGLHYSPGGALDWTKPAELASLSAFIRSAWSVDVTTCFKCLGLDCLSGGPQAGTDLKSISFPPELLLGISYHSNRKVARQ